jgi:hypothetical protein
MSLPDTAKLLEDAAERIREVALSDLQPLLRRAGLRLRNSVGLEWS